MSNQEEGIHLQMEHNRNARCIAALFRGTDVDGTFLNPFSSLGSLTSLVVSRVCQVSYEPFYTMSGTTICLRIPIKTRVYKNFISGLRCQMMKAFLCPV